VFHIPAWQNLLFASVFQDCSDAVLRNWQSCVLDYSSHRVQWIQWMSADGELGRRSYAVIQENGDSMQHRIPRNTLASYLWKKSFECQNADCGDHADSNLGGTVSNLGWILAILTELLHIFLNSARPIRGHHLKIITSLPIRHLQTLCYITLDTTAE